MRTIWFAIAVCICGAALAADPKPRVSMEILTQGNLAPTAAQSWYKTLSDLGVSGLQIHSAAGRAEPSISTQGNASRRTYKVVGVLSSDDVLHLPGGNFGPRDSARIKAWLEKLAEQGPEGVTEKPGAFGLSSRHLAELRAALKKPVDFSTKDVSAAKVVSRLADQLAIPLELDRGTMSQLDDVTIGDEMKGLASGTVVAAVLRPAGLALVPHRANGNQLRLRIDTARAGREAWPVGWPPADKPSQMVPAMFETLKVDIVETPVLEAVEAIRGRLDLPLLFDSNAMAMHGVDPAKHKAEVTGKQLSYSQILNKVLLAAKLQYEVRVDDADRPFLWITTIKRSG